MSRLNNPYSTGPGRLPSSFHMRRNILAFRHNLAVHDARETIKRLRKTMHAVTTPVVIPNANPFEGLDLKELRAEAKVRGIRGRSKMGKAELVEALKAAL